MIRSKDWFKHSIARARFVGNQEVGAGIHNRARLLSFRGASDNKTFSSLQLTYALYRGGAPQGNGVWSAGARTRSCGLFRKTRSQYGYGSDYQMLYRKLINEMSWRVGV